MNRVEFGRPMARNTFSLTAALVAGFLSLIASPLLSADDGEKVLTVDHYVRVKSTVPAIAGQLVQIYARELVQAGTALRAPLAGDRVVLFVHGAGTPAEVAFDVPYQDYSWMAYLAHAGFDVFSMDTTGYGRSTRPAPMNDPCNLAKDRQAGFVSSPCAPSYPHALTTIASDWNDIDAVVDYIRALRHVDRVSLFGWSLGGPRAGGYAGQHPEKVAKLVLLAPAYNRSAAATPPPAIPAAGVPMNTQSRQDFTSGWDRQVGCPDQYDPAAAAAVWSEMLASDPVGATWGPGVRRAPQTTVWGWTPALAAKMQMPTLLVAGAHDKQVSPDRVRELYADLGAREKVFIDLACSSHNAMWERNHLLLFRASLEWLTGGTVNGAKDGQLKLGYGKSDSQ
jgi:pimeloyl-ACP methyl ester carboxylesterase